MSSKKTKQSDALWFPGGTGGIDGSSPILGIDPSLSSTGLCLLNGRKLTKSRTLSSGRLGAARLLDLRNQLHEYLSITRVDAAVIEGYSYGSSNNREVLAEWGGLIRVTLFEREIPLLVVAPPTLRKFVLSDPGSGKDKMILASFKRWGVEFATNDECDAHALAQLGSYRLDIESGGIPPESCLRMTEAAKTAAPYIFGNLTPKSVRPRRRNPESVSVS